MKTRLSAAPMTSHRTTRTENVEMYNLYRRKADDAGFSPAGRPRLYAGEGVVPLAADTSGVIVDDGEYIGVLDTARTTTCRIERIGAVARCALPTRDSVIVMCADGPHVMPRGSGGQPSDSGGIPVWDGVSITAESAEYLTMTTDAVVLGREYNPGMIGSPADRTALQHQVRAAYERTAADAARAGVFIAPVIARATLRDAAGAVLWRGPEVLLTVPGENVFDRTIEIEMQDSRTVGASTRDIPTYRLHVHASPTAVQAWADRAAKLEIEVAPQFHPWKPASTCHGTVSVARRQSGGMNVLVSMPALEMGVSSNWPARSAYLVKAVTSAFDSVARVTATILNPLERGVDTIAGANGWPDLVEESASLAAVLGIGTQPATPSEVVVRRLSPPHSFAARRAAAGGTAILWANISLERYRGYSAADMASEILPDVGWTSCTEVTFADGSSAVRIARGDGYAPWRLGCLISYPDASARRMDVKVEYDIDGAPPRHWRIDLQPDASGTRAIAIDTGLKGRTGVDDTSAWITAGADRRAVPIEMPGMCVAAHPDRPLEPLAVIDTDATVHAVNAARGAGGAWNYGRSRFYAFCNDRVEMVTAERGVAGLASTRISDMGIPSPEAVVSRSDGSTVFANGRLLHLVTPAGTLKTFTALDSAVDRLGYDPNRDEVIAADSDGATAYHIGADGRVATRTTSPGPSNEWLTAGNRVLAATQNGLLGLTMDDRIPDDTDIMLRTVVVGPKALRGVTWHIDSTRFKGVLRVSRVYLGPRIGDTSTVRIDGKVHHPLRIPLAGRPMGRAILEMTASVSPDTMVNLPEIY